MKRYKMNERQAVNTRASKTGFKWRYRGTYDSIEAAVQEAKKWSGYRGVKVIDTKTNEVVYKEEV